MASFVLAYRSRAASVTVWKVPREPLETRSTRSGRETGTVVVYAALCSFNNIVYAAIHFNTTSIRPPTWHCIETFTRSTSTLLAYRSTSPSDYSYSQCIASGGICQASETWFLQPTEWFFRTARGLIAPRCAIHARYLAAGT